MLNKALPIVRAVRSQQLARVVRRGDHNYQAPGDSLPFDSKKKGAVTAGVVGYMMLGFAIPFIAVKYTLTKNGRPSPW